MTYKPRPGILFTKICNTHVLIPNREAQQYCPRILRLPLLWAATWEALEKDKPMEDIYRFHQILTKKSDEEIRTKVDGFLAQLCEQGFLMATGEDDAS